MARKSASTISQEDLYLPSAEFAGAESAARQPVPPDKFDDARLLDLEAEQENQFLRAQKRVSVRRGPLPKKAAVRILWGVAALAILGACFVAAYALYDYGEHSWRFHIDSSDNLEISGLQNVSRKQVIEAMGDSIQRNIFFVPLAQCKSQLEQIPWVESASVMRFVPNRIRIEIVERTPVAFARIGSRIQLIDASGVLMELPPSSRKKYSFPVIIGNNANEPLSTRTARINIYRDLMNQFDSDGTHYSQDLSEVDLSDLDDVKVLAGNPANNSDGEVLIHLGSSDYLARYKIYVAHEREWRAQFQRLDSVDLRYDHQVIVNPDPPGVPKLAPLSLAAARALMSAGVQQTTLRREFIGPKPLATAAKPNARKLPVRSARHADGKSQAARAKPKSGEAVAAAASPQNHPPAATSLPATTGSSSPKSQDQP